MKIAIATKSAPKSKGVRNAFETFPYFGEKPENIEFVLHGTPSGVSDMPLSEEETITGAKNRVRTLRNLLPGFDYYVGVEGGASKIEEDYFLFGAAYIENTSGEGHVGVSGKVEIPKEIARPMHETGKELSQIVEERTNHKNLKHENGTIGLLSRDFLPRDKASEDATNLALVRFFRDQETGL